MFRAIILYKQQKKKKRKEKKKKEKRKEKRMDIVLAGNNCNYYSELLLNVNSLS